MLWCLALKGGLLSSNVAMDPVKVAVNFGINAIVVEAPTALTPAHQAHEEPSAAEGGDHGSPTVTFAGIPRVPKDACAQHVLRDPALHGLDTLIARGHRNLDEVEDEGAVSPGLTVIAPACHHCLLASLGELTLGEATVWEADGHNGLREGGRPGQAEQCNIIVIGTLAVVGMHEDLLDVQVHLPLLPAPQVILPCRAEGLSEWVWGRLTQ